MEVVTNKENVLRGNGITAINNTKTHCLNGHLLPTEKIDGKRHCIDCARKRWKEYRKRKIENGTWKKR